MHDVCLVLQQVVDALNNMPFPEHYPVPHRHEFVLHVRLQAVNQEYALIEKALEEFFPDVSPVGEDLSVWDFREDAPYPHIPAVNVCACQTECYDISLVIAHHVHLEPVTPSHRSFSVFGHACEHLVEVSPHVVAHRYHRAVNESDSRTLPEGGETHEEHHLEEHFGHEFHKAVV